MRIFVVWKKKQDRKKVWQKQRQPQWDWDSDLTQYSKAFFKSVTIFQQNISTHKKSLTLSPTHTAFNQRVQVFSKQTQRRMNTVPFVCVCSFLCAPTRKTFSQFFRFCFPLFIRCISLFLPQFFSSTFFSLTLLRSVLCFWVNPLTRDEREREREQRQRTDTHTHTQDFCRTTVLVAVQIFNYSMLGVIFVFRVS